MDNFLAHGNPKTYKFCIGKERTCNFPYYAVNSFCDGSIVDARIKDGEIERRIFVTDRKKRIEFGLNREGTCLKRYGLQTGPILLEKVS